MRIRALVNAELVAVHPNGNDYVFQFGAGTFVEVKRVEVYTDGGEEYANFLLVNGDRISGVSWGPEFFENHGATEVRVKVPKTKVDVASTVKAIKKDDEKNLVHFGSDDDLETY